MIISKMKLLFIISVVFISIFCANIAIELDIGMEFGRKNKFENKVDTSNISMGKSNSQIMYFLQISDLHLSIFNDPSRTTEFEEFCSITVNTIKPVVVLASGDLTDAKHKNNMGSAQYKEEWILYNKALNKCNIKNKTLWLDIRGNHDNFDVPGWKSHLNYFRNYSIQGPENPLSYMHIIHKYQKFAFIGVDACLEPGPRRPFNFIGILTRDETHQIKLFVEEAKKKNVDHIIWFGHYPSSCIISADDSVRNLIGDIDLSRVYLCGHLHTMGGLVTEMYTLQKQGYLELELGDWKDNRMYRLAAFDHGLFSFIDIQHGNWPIILITNPKHALYVMPEREPLQIMKKSSHIRLLAFSLSPIVSVQVQINNNQWINCEHVEDALYVCKWSPLEFSYGLHDIYAKVEDELGRKQTIKHPFSLDGTKMSFKLLGKTALMMNAVRMFQCLFGFMIMISVLPLIIIRYKHQKMQIQKTPVTCIRRGYCLLWLRRFWVLSTVDKLFFPLVIYEIYLIFGPWSFGEVMEGHMGAIFSWGIIMNGIYLPGSFTYAYGFIQMLICQFPLTLILAKFAEERYQLHWKGKTVNRSLFRTLIRHIPFIFIISTQMVFAYFFWLAYGTLAFLIGPLRTWSIILNLYLWFKATTLSPEETREIATVWFLYKKQYEKSTTKESL